MKFLKLYEAFIQENEFLLIVKKGTELFHGTVESFDKKNIRPGGYDEVLWTADNSAVAQTYIPVSSTLYATTNSFVGPTKNQQTIQRQLGINYDYSQVEWNGNRPSSYMTAPCFKELSDEYYRQRDKYMDLDAKYKRLKEEYIKKLSDMIESGINKEEYQKYTSQQREILDELKDEVEISKSEWYENKIEKNKNKFVNDKLYSMGYKPTSESKYDENHTWKLKLNRVDDEEVLMPANWKEVGRLMIIKPKRDLRIYDYTLGGKRHADLGDLDYHKIDLFRNIEEKGYDGIRITDYCQSEDQGNFGHLSIGLFRNTLKDIEIDEIPASHQELEQFYRSRDWKTPEYKEYKKSK